MVQAAAVKIDNIHRGLTPPISHRSDKVPHFETGQEQKCSDGGLKNILRQQNILWHRQTKSCFDEEQQERCMKHIKCLAADTPHQWFRTSRQLDLR